MPNRLAASSSPYLLQHQDNPVDWWEWGPEAFAEAARRDVPVLLSIGYAACHWCHVMAHESFEDEDTAAYMNAHFVNVKVDREERPDVDAVYMEAVQAMTGHGGWPMTSFLTTKGEPFFCGTYWPPEPRHGMPAFTEVLGSVVQAWESRRGEVDEAGREVVERLSRPAPDDRVEVTAELLDKAAAALMRSYDGVHGGFGSAPKFPPSMVLEFLLRRASRTGEGLGQVAHTCEAMARGGMYDQLAGGFARYSVDEKWVVPHFEKMLYDNALLLRVYLHWWRATGSDVARRVCLETADFLLRDLGTAEGAFASALDADAAGVEGSTYVWTSAQLVDVLGPEDGAWAAEQLEVTPEGTFEQGASTLQRLLEPSDPERYDAVCARLLEARALRPQPGRDDKVVAAWNGLAVAALAETGVLLDEPRYVQAAASAMALVQRLHWVDGRLRRVSRDGVVGAHAGVLEDYADVSEGLLALYWATGDLEHLRGAHTLLEVVLEQFADGKGGFFDTAHDAEQLVRRPQDPTDNATPSGAAAAAGALLTYAALTGSDRHRRAAEECLTTLAPLFGRHARFAGWALAVAEALVAGPAEVVVLDRADLLSVARLATSPGAVVAVNGPLAEGREPGAAYVCRRSVCELPTRDAARLKEQLAVVL
ncbi:MAG TPA: thioredoxin domain-containing protein [Mycobacteriales bacterium]|nr:thioredoxin domain-containing protein [Mycobacteriales bacterium]